VNHHQPRHHPLHHSRMTRIGISIGLVLSFFFFLLCLINICQHQRGPRFPHSSAEVPAGYRGNSCGICGKPKTCSLGSNQPGGSRIHVPWLSSSLTAVNTDIMSGYAVVCVRLFESVIYSQCVVPHFSLPPGNCPSWFSTSGTFAQRSPSSRSCACPSLWLP